MTVIVCASSTSSWRHTGLLTTVLSASVCVSWCPSCRKPLWASLFSTCAPSAWTGQCFHTPHCFMKSHQSLTCDGPRTLFSFSIRSFYNLKEAVKFFCLFFHSWKSRYCCTTFEEAGKSLERILNQFDLVSK